MSDRECVGLLRWALPRMGLRWEGFRRVRRQVCKRIGRRVGELGLAGMADYRSLLEADPDEWARLDAFCRVTISRFFRDRGAFERLGELLAARASPSAPLRLWSAGCASGEEPYSLSILFHEVVEPAVPGARLELLATDADASLVERARHGCYPEGSLVEVPPRWRERAFVRRGELWCLDERFREGVALRCEDLREAMPDGPFALIACRNLVFTYFGEPLCGEVLEKLLVRLEPGGLLFVGAHESVAHPALEQLGRGVPLYCKRSGA